MLQYPKHLVKFQTSHQNSKMAAEMFEKFTSLFTSNLSVKAEEEEEEEEEEVNTYWLDFYSKYPGNWRLL